ncbi:hypothetical protein [Nocardia aurantia]|uniref:Uncharacterized protein n=1 Tax=Nocardia aurantia TaxID=2585199 RepID=A0A7K0DZ29_9NOCA|nr:hypothetical protein [Nocardia aurantia]MQY30532.1 hypothetical protein [Nocardia aurantia]
MSRVAIRTAVADLRPGRDNSPDPTGAEGEPQQPIRIEIPGTVTAPPRAHRLLLAAAQAAAGENASSADRKALRIYRDRLNTATGADTES